MNTQKKLILLAALAAGAAVPAHGSNVWTQAVAGVGTYNPNGYPSSTVIYGCFQDNLSNSTCQGTLFASGLEGSGDAFASAGLGILHARAEAALDGVPSYFPGGFAGASAYFHDAFTVSGGGCVNCFSQGFLLVSGTLAGGVTSTNPSGADATGGFTVGLWTDGGRSGSCEVHMGTSPGSNSPGFSCTAELLFAAGDVVHMDAVLSAGVTLTLGHGSVYGAAEFGDTAWITGLELLDSNRQAATGVTLISESGVDYTSIAENGAAPAPEPSTIILFAGALVLIAASRVSFRTRR